MKPAPFEYAAPLDIGGALALLASDNAVVLAGGQSLIPLMNLRRVRPAIVVDLNAIADLAFVEASPGELRIGAMTRQSELEHSTIVAEGWPLLSAAVARVGHAATRSRGTVGGSVAFGDPRAQLPVALAALDARLELRSPGASRLVSIGEPLAPGELLTAISVPRWAGAQMAYVEYARTRGDWALAGAAVVVAPRTHAAIALLGAGTAPVRATGAERALVAGASRRRTAELAAREVADDYRRALVQALVERALERVVR
jgi:aerobic carbon-monoxide dehydrogenase medium subunit